MLVRKISIFLIILIILIELYINYFVKLEVESSNFTNTELAEAKEIIIVDKKPWDKIKETKENNYYYINIIHFDEVKFIEWKNIIPDLEYGIHNKLLKIPSKDEERAMSIVNLIISNMKGDIELNEIIKNDLINKSIIKSRKFNVVFTKIKNLVLENNVNSNLIQNKDKDNIVEKEILDELSKVDTFNINNNLENNNSSNNNSLQQNQNDDKQKQNQNDDKQKQNESNNKSLKPEDYNYDGFNNSHYNIFKKDKLIRNNLTAGAYGGKQYARPFR